RASTMESSRHAAWPAASSESCHGVAPSSRRKIKLLNGPVSPRKAVKRSVADSSTRIARRTCGVNSNFEAEPTVKISAYPRWRSYESTIALCNEIHAHIGRARVKFLHDDADQHDARRRITGHA